MQKLAGGHAPIEVRRVRQAGLGRNVQRPVDGGGEVLVQNARAAAANDITRPRHRISGHRDAAGQRFKHHQAQRVGLGRKDEHVGGAVVRHQGLAHPRAEKHCLREAPLQGGPRRAVAHQHLGAGPVNAQERLDVLFHGQPPNVHEYRAGQVQLGGRNGPKQGRVHSPDPAHHRRDAMLAKQPIKGRGRAHGVCRGVVKAPQQRVGPAFWKSGTQLEIERKQGVEGSSEAQIAPPEPMARAPAKRPFGGDVHRVRRKGFDQAPHPARPGQRQPDFGVGRAGDGAESIRAEHLHFVAHAHQPLPGGGQRPHDAVQLRQPSVADDQNAHVRRDSPLGKGSSHRFRRPLRICALPRRRRSDQPSDESRITLVFLIAGQGCHMNHLMRRATAHASGRAVEDRIGYAWRHHQQGKLPCQSLASACAALSSTKSRTHQP